MDTNVKIPLSLLNNTVDLLEDIDISVYEEPIPCLYDMVLSAFRQKRERLDLRKSYSKIIFAEDEDERILARMQYLQHKRDYERVF